MVKSAGWCQLMFDFIHAFFNELKIVYRSKMMIVMTVVIPVVTMVVMGLIFPNVSNMKNYKIAVYNADKGVYSNLAMSLVYAMIRGRTLVRVGSKKEMDKLLNNGSYDGAILVPKGFSKAVEDGKRFDLVFIPSTINIQTSVIIYNTFKTLLSEIGNAVVVRNVLELYKNPKNRVPIAIPKLTILGSSDKKMNYVNFMIPGFAVLIAMASVSITLSTSVSYEKEHGVLKGILISSVNRPLHILGKIVAHTIDGTFKGLLALIGAQLFFYSGLGTPFRSIFVLLIGAFAFAGIGMVISTISPSQRLSNILSLGYVLPSVFVSGLFLPIHQMPKIAQLISKAFPITFMADAMQRMNILNYSIPAVFWGDIFPLILYSAIFVTLAIVLFFNIERIQKVS